MPLANSSECRKKT